jgi:LVIVD repeat
VRRLGTVAAVVVFLSTVPLLAAPADPLPGTSLCGSADLPEGTGLDGAPTPQLQGDVPKVHHTEDASGLSRAEAGYNCGLALVAREVLDADGRMPTGNANMAVASHCAYVAGPGTVFGPATYTAAADAGGVAVVDVSNPTDPEHVETLKGSGATSLVSETLHAIDVLDPATSAVTRSILVAGQYGNFGSGGNKPMEVYDVTGDRCEHPVHLGTVVWPENIHNLTISGNGRYVFATQPTQVVDISPMFEGKPYRHLGNLDNVLDYPLVPPAPGADLDDLIPGARQQGLPTTYFGHEAAPSYDGTSVILGSQTPAFDVFTIADIGPWLQRNPDGTPKGMPVIRSQRAGRGHSVTRASIAGHGRWVMHAEESVFGGAYGCVPSRLNPFAGAAEPSFTDVTDVDSPRMQVSTFGLEINRPENCLAQLDSGVQASVHYHEFDSRGNARIAIISMQNAGIRVVDIRDPAHPREVAYFNPGDVDAGPEVILDNAWGHPHYDAMTGQIWFATSSGGFWVVELEEQVRRYLALEAPTPSLHDSGAPGTRGTAPIDLPIAVEVPPMWCTLGVATSTV